MPARPESVSQEEDSEGRRGQWVQWGNSRKSLYFAKQRVQPWETVPLELPLVPAAQGAWAGLYWDAPAMQPLCGV